MSPGLLALWLLAAAPDGGALEEAGAPAGVRVRGGLELGAQLLPSRGGDGVDGYLVAHPLVRLEVGDAFALQVGAALRADVVDLPPAEAAGWLRAADWDEASDFGQLLEELTLGREGGPVSLAAGPVRAHTLGLGHLVARYSNQENADYHPAAATLTAAAGPLKGELFASDALGARLFAGELGWDLGRTFSADAAAWDRWVLALEVAHDASRAGLPTRTVPGEARAHPPPVTLAQLDASGVLVRTAGLGLTALAGAGLRLDRPASPGFGAVLGAALDLRLGPVGLSVKAEGRSQAGGFRQGFFGPAWEVARYADTGLSGPSQADADLPPGYSVALEARVGVGTALSLGASAEHFFFGRTDLDASLAVGVGPVVAEARYGVVALELRPRHALGVVVRVRVAPSFYLLAGGGTAFLPRPDGTLQRGLSASAGLGLDFGGAPAR